MPLAGARCERKIFMSEISAIENYLAGTLNPADRLLMEAQLLINSDLKEKVVQQQEVYDLVKLHGRRRLKQELETVHAKLFSEKRFEGFRKKIMRVFTNH